MVLLVNIPDPLHMLLIHARIAPLVIARSIMSWSETFLRGLRIPSSCRSQGRMIVEDQSWARRSAAVECTCSKISLNCPKAPNRERVSTGSFDDCRSEYKRPYRSPGTFDRSWIKGSAVNERSGDDGPIEGIRDGWTLASAGNCL